MIFGLNRIQTIKYEEWLRILPDSKLGDSIGRITFSFTPIGDKVIIKVKDNVTDNVLDLTEE